MVCELKHIPKNQREFFDMSKCPDCGRIQSCAKDVGDSCDNDDCESYVELYNHKNSKKDGMPVWNNDNWG